MQDTDVVREVRRQLEICNACRYCEGYCAVFPAMTRRREFTDADVGFLANLCHNCKGCFHACQYAPPHEFGVNLPKAMAQARSQSYADYAWPRPMGRLFQRNGAVVALATTVALALAFATALSLGGGAFGAPQVGPNSFYRVVPWAVMASTATAVVLWSMLALSLGGLRFWRDLNPSAAAGLPASSWREALGDILTLRNLGGGQHGCNDVDESFSQGRRIAHHALFYGFTACFASTCSAFLLADVLRRPPPYPLLSVPVLLGGFGGLLMIGGGLGLTVIRLVTDRRPTEPALLGGELGILALLIGVAVTGLLLLGLRGTPAMALLLSAHLGGVLSFFLLAPYSRMTHGLYRGLALLKARAEVGRRARPASPVSPRTALQAAANDQPAAARATRYVTVLGSLRNRDADATRP